MNFENRIERELWPTIFANERLSRPVPFAMPKKGKKKKVYRTAEQRERYRLDNIERRKAQKAKWRAMGIIKCDVANLVGGVGGGEG